MRAQANWARFDEDQVGAVNVNDVADAMTDEPTPTLDAADARPRLVSQDGILQAGIEFSD